MTMLNDLGAVNVHPIVSKYQFLGRLQNLHFVNKLILFGSRARGDNDDRADIDLAVECADDSTSRWSQVMEIIENADTLLKIDCIRFDQLPLESLIRQNILAEGVVLYEKNRTKIR